MHTLIPITIGLVFFPLIWNGHRDWQRRRGIAPKRSARVRFFMWLQRQRKHRKIRHYHRLEAACRFHMEESIALANELKRLRRKLEVRS